MADIRGGADDSVNKTAIRINANTRLYTEVALIALLGLVHIGVTFPSFVTGGIGRRNEQVHPRLRGL